MKVLQKRFHFSFTHTSRTQQLQLHSMLIDLSIYSKDFCSKQSSAKREVTFLSQFALKELKHSNTKLLLPITRDDPAIQSQQGHLSPWKREGNWVKLTFAQTSGIITGTKKKIG